MDAWTHKKTGGIYIVLVESKKESDPSVVLVTYRNVATGEVWTRPRSEFFDGRFEPL